MQDSYPAGSRLNAFLRRHIEFVGESTEVVGLSAAVTVGNETIYSGAFGHANRDHGQPMSCEVPIDVASQTKLLVLLAMLQIRRKYGIYLSDPIARYIPELSGESIGLTSLHQLLTHSSGLMRDFIDTKQEKSLVELVQSESRGRPDARFPHYSNVGFMLLAEIIQRVSGLGFYEYAEAHILSHLNLTNTYLRRGETPNSCVGYQRTRSGQLIEVASESPRHPGATGLWATPEDLCQLYGTLFGADDGIISLDDAMLCTTRQWGPETQRGIRRAFGLGLEERTISGMQWFGHTGGANGFVSATFLQRNLKAIFSIGLNERALSALGGLIDAIGAAIKLFSRPENASLKDALEAKYCRRFVGPTGHLEILRLPQTFLLIDPYQINPFAGAYELRQCPDDSLEVHESDFEYGGTRLALDDVALVFGGQEFNPMDGNFR